MIAKVINKIVIGDKRFPGHPDGREVYAQTQYILASWDDRPKPLSFDAWGGNYRFRTSNNRKAVTLTLEDFNIAIGQQITWVDWNLVDIDNSLNFGLWELSI